MIAERTKLTPPELAARWGIGTDKILAWIRRKELRAINAATRAGGRPRFLIDLKDIVAFERRREVDAEPVPTRRRKPAGPEGVTEYF